MKVLELNNVYKDYKLDNKEKFTALHNINVSFEKGELVSIVGESGSGKSTLMNLIGGLDSDFQGDINISGQNIKNFKPKELDDYRKKKIGFVFQSFNLISHLSVLENVTIGLTLSNVKDSIKNQKAIELLTKLGLEDQIKKKPTQLSGGQKQRVAIARALINDPDIILADEPTGALDSGTTEQILKILKEIADEGKLVIMVTHSEKVAKISSRIVEISDGKIIRDEINPNYQKTEGENIIQLPEEKDNNVTPKKEGHLSLFSAIKLSFHNMWASKTKNILMAVGVSICLISMILMLSFGAGLTGYIADQAEKYSDPKYATISKRSKTSITVPELFSDEEVLQLKDDVNAYLKKHGNKFRAVTQQEDEYEYNVYYGFSMISMASAKITYNPPATDEEPTPKPKEEAIFYTYTTPPYYYENPSSFLLTKNSKLPKKGSNEIMLSAAASKSLGIENLEDIVGKELTLKVDLSAFVDVPPIELPVKISGIVDVSLFSGMLVMYIDYDFLSECVLNQAEGVALGPSLLYIKTDSTQTTDLINDFVESREDLTGSLEEKLVDMFNQMLETFTLALAIIAGISLVVALIMILVVLYMSVSERTREIGIMKSIGARSTDIKKIFTTESFLIGVFSGIMGIILTLIIGGILTLVLKSVLGLAPIRMLWYYFLEAFALSIVISVIAGLYPASKAAKLDPVESLRHE